MNNIKAKAADKNAGKTPDIVDNEWEGLAPQVKAKMPKKSSVKKTFCTSLSLHTKRVSLFTKSAGSEFWI